MKQSFIIHLTSGVLAILQWCSPCVLAEGTEPRKSLTYYHFGCHDGQEVSHPNCLAAMHRYCMYTHPSTPIAFPQKLKPGVGGQPSEVEFLCMSPTSYKAVPFGLLPGCSLGVNGNATSG